MQAKDNADSALDPMRQLYMKKTNGKDSNMKQSQKMFQKFCQERHFNPNKQEERRSRGWMVEWPVDWSEEQFLVELRKSSDFKKVRSIHGSVSSRLAYSVLNDPVKPFYMKRFGLEVYG